MLFIVSRCITSSYHLALGSHCRLLEIKLDFLIGACTLYPVRMKQRISPGDLPGNFLPVISPGSFSPGYLPPGQAKCREGLVGLTLGLV